MVSNDVDTVSALRNKAKILESQTLVQKKLSLAHISGLDGLVKDTYHFLRPKPDDYATRRKLVDIFNYIAKEVHGNSRNPPSVEVYGSFVMDMFSKQSDLDLSVNFGNPLSMVELPREEKIKTLRLFANKFYALQRSGHVTGVEAILSARVPIVKVVDQGTGVECDISIENRDGILKSRLIYIISAIDGRFQKLSVLMKAWAKAHNINSSRDRTLNSLTIISLVAFHLQTRNPPILPPFSVLFEGGTDLSAVMNRVQTFLNYGKKNEESLGTLFLTLLVKLASVETLWRGGLCASVYEGLWISKTTASISVEDFSDRSENVARAVSKRGVKKIYGCIHQTIKHLRGYLDQQISGAKLKEVLFGADDSTVFTLQSTVSNLHKRTAPPAPLDHRIAKRVCVSHNRQETQLARILGNVTTPFNSRPVLNPAPYDTRLGSAILHDRSHFHPFSIPYTFNLQEPSNGLRQSGIFVPAPYHGPTYNGKYTRNFQQGVYRI